MPFGCVCLCLFICMCVHPAFDEDCSTCLYIAVCRLTIASKKMNHPSFVLLVSAPFKVLVHTAPHNHPIQQNTTSLLTFPLTSPLISIPLCIICGIWHKDTLCAFLCPICGPIRWLVVHPRREYPSWLIDSGDKSVENIFELNLGIFHENQNDSVPEWARFPW